MKKQSILTFGDLTENLVYIKIIYNGKVIYNDETGVETLEHLEQIKSEYKNKIIYKMNVVVTEYYHCILKIKGE